MVVDPAEQSPLYVHYTAARKYLAEKLNATPHEIAMWVWLGSDGERLASGKNTGLRAYRDAANCKHVPVQCDTDSAAGSNETLPERFRFPDWLAVTASDYLSDLNGAYFLRSDLEVFDPEERYIALDDLCDRWENHLSRDEAVAQIRGTAAFDIDLPLDNPLAGGRLSGQVACYTEESLRVLLLPAIEANIFSMTDVRFVEAHLFGIAPAEPVTLATSDALRKTEQPDFPTANIGARQDESSGHVNPEVQFIREHEANLARGRTIANAGRRQEALEKYAKVEKAIERYLGAYPNGLNLSDRDILRFLKPSLDELDYAPATLLKKVKKITKRERAKVKETVPGLASP